MEVDGPVYVHSGERVSPFTSYKVLVAASQLTDVAQRREWISELNRARNLSLLGHGAAGADARWARQHLGRLGAFVQAVIGDDRWRMRARTILPRPKLGIRCLFDVHPGIETYPADVDFAPAITAGERGA